MDQLFNTIWNVVHDVISWFANLVPGTGFGLILIPLIVLGLISLLVARR